MHRAFLALLPTIVACGTPFGPGGAGPTSGQDSGQDSGHDSDGGAGTDSGTTADGGTDQPGDSLRGFIGSPCATDADCDYDGGTCLTDGFPEGTCSAPCDQYCDDQDGHPVTFCADGSDLPAAAAALGDGACLSRCDFGLFPTTDGCRDGYGCVVVSRANEPETETYACLPGRDSELSQCHRDLAARGVAFEPTVVTPDSPDDHPELTCTVEDAVYLHGPMLGVDLRYYDGSETERVLGTCTLGLALADSIEDVAAEGVDTLYHYGTYNCRVISGTDDLSRHGYGDAIDIYGFGFSDGRFWTLVDDWEHDTSDPQGDAGQWLYDTAYAWYDARIWSIILTPNYNSAHDDHFHVDLTPGSDYIGFRGLPWLGPNTTGE